MAGSTSFVLVSLLLYVFMELLNSPWELKLSVKWITFYGISANLVSSVSLNVFYYSQIVPAKHAFFFWLKKNVRMIIYCTTAVLHLLFLFHLASQFFYINSDFNKQYFFASLTTNSSDLSFNDTKAQSLSTNIIREPLLLSVLMYLEVSIASLALWMMSASSLSTVRYLRHHMKNMEVSGSSFSTPQLQSQMRVTVTGIVQEALYFLVSSWIITKICLFQNLVSTVDLDNHILVTVFTLYCFGTTINLGVGQSVFRQKAASLWQPLRKT
ncbi:taste receptor type 2 member 8-like [Denticeps clupeoides]|uniref:taste receptor type 2 member 8-like n=1 Tax=Denticeps clupeoides TaxID=299321 RepID=UPI0010A35A61|nr:taste receptor type 2 member 8-like [Denticeps clupeoides]